jgi:hypothetical protein
MPKLVKLISNCSTNKPLLQHLYIVLVLVLPVMCYVWILILDRLEAVLYSKTFCILQILCAIGHWTTGIGWLCPVFFTDV